MVTMHEPIGQDPGPYWRDRARQLHEQLRAVTAKWDEAKADTAKAEHTIREQQIEIARLKRQLAEARSAHGAGRRGVR